MGILIALNVVGRSASQEPYTPRTALFLSQRYVEYGAEEKCWRELITRESGGRIDAQNPYSTAYGLAQFLDSTWASTGYDKSSDPKIQLAAMEIYVKNRYNTFCNALNFQIRNNYY